MRWFVLGWVGLVLFGFGCIGLGWFGLGSVGLGWFGLAWVGLVWVGFGLVGLGLVWVGWVRLGWFGLVWVGLDSPRRPLKSPLRHPKRAQEGPENLPRQVAHVGPPASFKIEPCLRENHPGHEILISK